MLIRINNSSAVICLMFSFPSWLLTGGHIRVVIILPWGGGGHASVVIIMEDLKGLILSC
jgi:hypothetical protein